MQQFQSEIHNTKPFMKTELHYYQLFSKYTSPLQQ